jgi:hypothetical protein
VEFLESDAGSCFVVFASRKIQEVISNRQVQFKSVFLALLLLIWRVIWIWSGLVA